MSLSINSNSLAYGIGRNLSKISQDLQDTSERISTGKRILSAKDDPAGVGILMGMKAQHGSWNAVEKNLASGQSLLDVAEGALKNQNDLLTKMTDIANQAASDLISTDQRTALQNTFVEMQGQLDTIVNRASIFGQNLVSSTAANVKVQTGPDAGNTTTLSAIKSDAATLGVDAATIDLTDSTKAAAALTALKTAVNTVSGNQSVIGAQQSGFESLVNTAGTAKGNLEKAMGRIEDADVAAESTKLAMLQAKQQLGIQMLGIVNQMPSMALQLLR